MVRLRTAPLAASLALIIAAPVWSAPAPSRTLRVSTTANGAELVTDSLRPSVSDDGRFVLFESVASNLAAGDTNGVSDIFLRDLERGTIERMSVAANGAQGNDESYAAFMTPDARFVGFVSKASNLVPGDTNSCVEPTSGRQISCPDIFVRNRASNAVERVSISSDGLQANKDSHNGVVITPDGRFLAFWSDATNLVPGDTNNRGDVFVRDRLAGITERISVGSGGAQANANSSEPAISADGRFVAFRSYASNLTGIEYSAGQFSDIYVHDRMTHETERVSVSSDGEDGIVNAYRPDMSADGRYVTFDSEATNLVPADTNGFGYDVFVHDRLTGRTEQVSVSSAGIQANDSSYKPSITPDGRYVAFLSESTNLGPDDGGTCFQSAVTGFASCRDLFIHDRATGQTDLLTVPVSGSQMNGNVWSSDLSADARHLVFETASSALSSDDTNASVDIFLTDRGPATGIGELAATPGQGEVTVTGWARFRGESVHEADSPTDAGPGARHAGTELIGARLSYRPEEADLLARLDLDRLPPTPRPFSAAQARVTSLPGVVYGMELSIGATRFELRATRGATSRWTNASSFTLVRCDPACTQVATLTGSIGATGEHVNIAVPLSELGASSGAELTGVRGFVGPGEAMTGAAAIIDDVRLPAVRLSPPSVALGIAEAGAPESEVSLTTPAQINDGRFAGTIDNFPLSPGPYDIWARACVETRCGSLSARVAL